MDISNPSTKKFAQLLADARQRLVSTGTRNRLVHTSRFAKQGKAIDIVQERSDDVFQLLVTDTKRMRFAHDPSITESAEKDEPVLAIVDADAPSEGRYTDQILQTRFGADKLQKKLLSIAREARTLEDEQGINALYLAMGFLRWYEDEKSQTQREAPLVLVPVSLRRNQKTSTYDLEFRGDDITTNEPLKYRLNDDFGLGLPAVPENEGWTPSQYFDAVDEIIRAKPRWSIDRDGMQLGFFSFAKLLMVKDLEQENWPSNGLDANALVRGLLVDGFTQEQEEFGDGTRLDEVFAPADLVQVRDADASQTLVIETVRRGKNLVVQGPPGTGKSQTITNIIASAVHDGKTVLFVAEKMVALSVVHDRLKEDGLRDVCLELHSRQANKRLVATELGRTLNAAGSAQRDADATDLTSTRDRLNDIAGVMHTPVGQSGVTPFRAVSTLIKLSDDGFAPVDLTIPGVGNWTQQQLDNVLSDAGRLCSMLERTGAKQDHPFAGVHRFDMLPMDRQRLAGTLAELVQILTEADSTVGKVANVLAVERGPTGELSSFLEKVISHAASLDADAMPFATLAATHGGIDRVRALAAAGRRYQAAQDAQTGIFAAAAMRAPIGHLRAMLASGQTFFGRFGSPYRNASAELASLMKQPLPKSASDRLSLLNALDEMQEANKELEALAPSGAEIFGQRWANEATDFTALASAADWLSTLLQIASGIDTARAVHLRSSEPDRLRQLKTHVAERSDRALDQIRKVVAELKIDIGEMFGVIDVAAIPFGPLAARAAKWRDNIERLDEWAQLNTLESSLRSLAGNEVADAAVSFAISPAQLKRTIRYIHAEAIYRQFAGTQSWATNMTSAAKAELVDSFRQRETSRRGAIAELIRNEHLARIPRGGMGAMGLIRGEIGKKRGHLPLRRLVQEAGATLQEIKPVFLMSPISIAQFLPPETVTFDLLVIDEASQVRPEDALGAVARAKQIVVVGDTKQLPPTSFFDRAVENVADDEPDDEGEADGLTVTGATELESVLTLCEARGLSSRMLRWHYRSQHPSLIEVSNRVFYGDHHGGLVTFPSPAATREQDGLVLTRVNGAYDRGGKRHNLKEADAIAHAVASHAVKYPRRSLGVVTFSAAQASAITERLEAMRQGDAILNEFMREREHEEFFVKSIENVQGDERDTILISVGYGPRIAGARLDSMAFGPVSTEGGERRLNVLFTRARFRTEVFVSFSPGDINLDAAKSVGARVLKQYLEYAELGDAAPARVLDEDPDSEFEVAVAAQVRRLGYEVEHQVGSAGYKIDLAVRHPERKERFMLAIECDGAPYHSAVWARERDRLRQEVLERLGWTFHRVWSTDWFHRRTDEVARLEAALLRAASAISQRAAVVEEVFDEAEDGPGDEELALVQPVHLPDYVVAAFAVPGDSEPHEVPLGKLAEIALRVVEVEGPIHAEEIARRIAGLFAKQRTGSRIAEAVNRALALLAAMPGKVERDGEFWMTVGQRAEVPLRNRSRAPLSLRKASMLPPVEVALAVARVLSDNGALSREELPRAVAVLFGFQRTGPEFRPAIVPVIDAMLSQGLITEDGSGIRNA